MISPYEIFTTHAPYTYIHVTHLIILWKNLQAYSIPHTVYLKEGTQNTTCSHLLGIVSQLREFHTIPSQIFTTFNSQILFSGNHLTSSKRKQEQHNIPIPKV